MDDEISESMFKRIRAEPYAKKMGIEPVELDAGYSKVKMVFNADMENMFGMAHGGAIFSLLDEAFEMAANSHGTVAVALSRNITYIKTALDWRRLICGSERGEQIRQNRNIRNQR